MSTRRRFLPALSLLVAFMASACTAILVPNEDDDLVARCDTSLDCPDTGDNRYVAQCVFGEGQSESSSKVCAADFEKIGCGPTAYPTDHPLSEAYAAADDAKALYGQCSMENRGKPGCPSVSGVCNSGFELNNDTGVCDFPNPERPAIYPPDVEDIAGQDALDQFCRWYFCDEDFVCDTSGSQPVCRPCSGSDPDDFGEGGCGTVYIQGEPSPIYTDPTAGNCSGDMSTEDAVFGPAPMSMP